ncbi:MAG: hypothetical protein V7711_02830 [Pseudomonadales bacterium]
MNNSTTKTITRMALVLTSLAFIVPGANAFELPTLELPAIEMPAFEMPELDFTTDIAPPTMDDIWSWVEPDTAENAIATK